MIIDDKVQARKEIENLKVYVPGKPIEEVQRELGLTQITKLASNENPYGCSPQVIKAIAEEMKNNALYPEATAPALSEKLAKRLNIEKDHIFFGNGSAEIISLLTRAYIRPGDEAIMADSTFPRYQSNVLIGGGLPIRVPLIDGVHDLDKMLAAITEKTRMIFICNPNNPTGTIVEKDRLRTFVENVPASVLLVMDEAYYEFMNKDDALDTVSLLAQYPNLVILRTFSKIYGLAALRIGYGLMHPSIQTELNKVKEAFNTNRLAQAAALAALDDNRFVEDCAQKNAAGRSYLITELEKMGLSCFASHANFLMVKVGRSGNEVFQGLLRQGVIVRSGAAFGYPETIRVTVGAQDENEIFIKALGQVLNQA